MDGPAEDDLLQACLAAPKHGLNAKTLILQAALAAGVDSDEDGSRGSPAKRQRTGLSELAQIVHVVHARCKGSYPTDLLTCWTGSIRTLAPSAHTPSPPALLHNPTPTRLRPASVADPTGEAAAAAASHGSEYLAAVPAQQRPLVPYIARSKIPRIHRQAGWGDRAWLNRCM